MSNLGIFYTNFDDLPKFDEDGNIINGTAASAIISGLSTFLTEELFGKKGNVVKMIIGATFNETVTATLKFQYNDSGQVQDIQVFNGDKFVGKIANSVISDASGALISEGLGHVLTGAARALLGIAATPTLFGAVAGSVAYSLLSGISEEIILNWYGVNTVDLKYNQPSIVSDSGIFYQHGMGSLNEKSAIIDFINQSGADVSNGIFTFHKPGINSIYKAYDASMYEDVASKLNLSLDDFLNISVNGDTNRSSYVSMANTGAKYAIFSDDDALYVPITIDGVEQVKEIDNVLLDEEVIFGDGVAKYTVGNQNHTISLNLTSATNGPITITEHIGRSVLNKIAIYGNGDDIIMAGPRDHIIDGGAGVDTLDFSDYLVAYSNAMYRTDLNIDLGSNTVINPYGGEQNIYNIENIIGGIGHDIIKGNALDNVFDGGKGSDILQGEGGFDTYKFSGNFGVDVISDSDQSGKIMIGNKEIAGLAIFSHVSKSGNDVYNLELGSTTYNIVVSNVNRDILIDASPNEKSFINNIIIKNFSNSNFGINLDGFTSTGPASMELRPFSNLKNFYLKDKLDELVKSVGNISAHSQNSLNTVASSTTSPPPRNMDPLTLDLDGDGIELISVDNSNVFFDLDFVVDENGDYVGDGVKENVGWVKGDDGLLVLDKDGNGQIDNILELFGKVDKTGTQELAEYDLNADGVINNSDAIFSELQVWQDFNSDGSVDSGELKTLNEHNVATINLTGLTELNQDVDGNIILSTGTYVNTDGSINDYANLELSVNQTNSYHYEYTDPNGDLIGSYDLNVETLFLPFVRGYGNVKALPIAASSDEDLLDLLINLRDVDVPNYSTINSKVEEILFKWMGVDHLEGMRGAVEEKKIAVFEVIMDEPYNNGNDVPDNSRMELFLNRAWDEFFNDFKLKILVQSTFVDIFTKNSTLEDGTINTEIPTYDFATDSYSVNDITNAEVIANIETKLEEISVRISDATDPNVAEMIDGAYEAVAKEQFLSEIFSLTTVLAWEFESLDRSSIINEILALKEANVVSDYNWGYHDYDENYYTSDIDDTSQDSETGEHDSIISGNKGDDLLMGYRGDDIYLFNKGDGKDQIHEAGHYVATDEDHGNDIILMGPGISKDDVYISGSFTNIIVKFKSTADDQISILRSSYLSGQVETILFSNGDTIDLTNPDRVFEYYGTDGDDTVRGYTNEDIIAGGLGNDILQGVNGDDTYLFNRGDGEDVISEYGDFQNYNNKFDSGNFPNAGSDFNNSLGNDTIKFGLDIRQEDLTFFLFKADLHIGIKDSPDDLIIIKSHFTNANQVENLKFQILLEDENGDPVLDENGEQVIEEQLWDLTQQDWSQVNMQTVGTDNADTIQGGWYAHNNNTIDAGEGNDSVTTEDGHDIIAGGIGDDYLDAGAGNDTYIFNIGDGKDTIYDATGYYNDEAAGYDKIQFGLGIDADDVILSRSDYMTVSGNNDLIITFAHSLDDKITIRDYYKSDSRGFTHEHQIEEFEFQMENADGTIAKTVMLAEELITLSYEGDENANNVNIHNYLSDSGNVVNTYGDDDSVLAGDGGDVIDLGEGDDYLEANNGDDEITGGMGDDDLSGGTGDDVYHYNIGDGSDVISEATNGGGVDVIKFGAGITAQDLEFSKTSEYVIISFVNSANDQIAIKYHSSTTSRVIEFLQFEDGSSMNITELNQSNVANYDTAYLGNNDGSDNYIYNIGDGSHKIALSSSSNKVVFGSDIARENVYFTVSGNDLVINLRDNSTDSIIIESHLLYNPAKVAMIEFSDASILDISGAIPLTLERMGTSNTEDIVTSNYNDIIYAGAGDDDVETKDGDDVIIGGLGDDRLEGGRGDDVYVYNVGDGRDDIIDASGSDIIKMGEGITKDDVYLTMNSGGYHFLVRFKDNDTDQIRIFNQFTYDTNSVETILFTNGDTINLKDQALKGQYIGTTGDDDINLGLNFDGNIVEAGKGDDIIQSSYYSDDTYIFNIGDGKDIIYSNNNDGGINKIKFGAGIRKDDIYFDTAMNIQHEGYGSHYNFVIRFNDNDNDQIAISYNHNYDHHTITTLEFEDGTILDISDVDLLDNVNESISGTASDDILDGRGGDDDLYGSDGDDILIGGTGDDSILGGSGHDTYIFNKGDGKDIIGSINNGDTNSNDKIVFGESILQENIYLLASGYNLIVKFRDNDSDQITLGNHLSDFSTKTELLEFYDGSVMDLMDIDNLQLSYEGRDVTDYIHGNEAANEIDAKDGDDRIFANGGDDIITGGLGDDYIYGGSGNDSYIFNIGDGRDTISDSEGSDKIQFGEGIQLEDIYFVKESYSTLHIKFANNSDDQITISSYFFGSIVEILEFFDGSTIDISDSDSFTFQFLTTDENDGISGSNNADIIDGKGGNDFLRGLDGDDILIGGLGDDNITGGAGSDSYIFNIGDGIDTITDNSGDLDKIIFGEGITAVDIYINTQTYNEDAHLYLNFKDNASDQIIIKHYASYDNNKVEQLQFADGSTLNIADLSVEYYGTDAADSIKSSDISADFNVTIYAGDGDDNINGGSGDETVYGEGGNDIISVRDGDNYVDGGDGDDQITTQNGNNEIYGGAGNDSVYAGAWSNTPYDNFVDLGDGDDYVNAGAGNDTIFGGEGEDQIYSGAGDDIIDGGEGNDEIHGEGGNNTLTGGLGLDKFIISNFEETSVDTITDFDISSSGDKIDLAQLSDVVYFSGFNIYQEGSDAIIEISNKKIVLKNIDHSQLSETNFSGLLKEGGYNLIGSQFNDDLHPWDISGMLDGDYISIYGGDGDDVLFDYYGNGDLLDGGAGDDILNVSQKNVTLFGGSGSDIFKFSHDSEAAIYHNVIEDFDLNDSDEKIILDGVENFTDLTITDSLNGAIVSYTIQSYNGVDITNNITLTGVSANQLTANNFEIKQVIQGDHSADDSIILGDDGYYVDNWGGNNIITTGSGDDIVGIGSGDDIVNLGAGDDYLYDDGGSNMINAGTGDDDIYLESYLDGTSSEIYAGEGNDTIQSYARSISNYKIFAEAGDDTIFIAFNSQYEVSGGDGNDTITSSVSSSFINGDAGNDTINLGASSNNNEISGGAGDDIFTLKKDLDSDTLGSGTDIITDFEINNLNEKIDLQFTDIDSFDDLQIAQSGEDSIITFNAEGRILILKNTASSDLTSGNFIFKNIATANDDDILASHKGVNVVNAKEGNDIITATGSENYITGGTGNDVFVIEENPGSITTITDFELTNINEKIQIHDFFNVQEFADLGIKYETIWGHYGVIGYDAFVKVSNTQIIIIKNVVPDSLTANNFNFTSSNIAPIAVNDNVSINEDNSLIIDITSDLLANDTDPEETIPSFNAIITNPSNGTLVNNGNGSLTYVPNDNYVGNDSFIYEVIDTSGEVSSATVHITINSVNDAPVISSPINNQIAQENALFTYAIPTNLFNDIDGDILTLNITQADGSSLPSWLSFNSVTNTLSGTPTDVLSDNVLSLIITATDQHNSSISQNFTIDVINTVPTDQLIKGSNGDDVIYGADGDDDLRGRGGDDILTGNEGNDILRGNQGNDLLTGGSGNDLLLGGSGNDALNGGQGNDRLSGNNGHDVIYGEKGNDLLQGGSGNDQLNGGQGDDILYGHDGRDILSGGAGSDFLHGGQGRDTFDFSNLSDSLNGYTDFINDFKQNQDIIDISDLEFTNISHNENQTDDSVLTYRHEGDSTFIENEDQTFQIEMRGIIDLTFGDFDFG